MNPEPLGNVFLNAVLINNFVLSAFLGICPFLGVSKKIETAKAKAKAEAKANSKTRKKIRGFLTGLAERI